MLKDMGKKDRKDKREISSLSRAYGLASPFLRFSDYISTTSLPFMEQFYGLKQV
jgi:hypothetical protein